MTMRIAVLYTLHFSRCRAIYVSLMGLFVRCVPNSLLNIKGASK